MAAHRTIVPMGSSVSNGARRVFFGGQAVIEGVMMRGPRHAAVAVRSPGGEIVVRTETLPAVSGWLRRVPILRGLVVLWETLSLGIRSLTWSSQVANGLPREELRGAQVASSVGVLLVFVGVLFFAAPVVATAWVGEATGSDYAELWAEGLLRIVLLVLYVAAIGRMGQIGRVFGYHGAEHRAIHAHERGEPLTAASVLAHANAHPRCGTAFLLTVMVLALFVFLALGTPPVWVRVIERLALAPVLAALAYEVLRLGQRFGDAPVVGWLYRPNTWLQRFTTRDPDNGQVEVAIVALERAIALEAAAGDARGAGAEAALS